MNNENIEYSRTIVPSSMRSTFWKYFGFPSDNSNNILTRKKIICTICSTAIAYNKNTSNLRTHLISRHPEILQKELQHVSTKNRLQQAEEIEEPPKKISNMSITMSKSIKQSSPSRSNSSQQEGFCDADYLVGDEDILSGQLNAPNEEVEEVIYIDNADKKSMEFSHIDDVEFQEFDVTVINGTDAEENDNNANSMAQSYALVDLVKPIQPLPNSSPIDAHYIANMLISDLLPISTISEKGLQQLMPHMENINKSIVTEKLCTNYDKMHTVISNHLQKVSQQTTYSLSIEYFKNIENISIINIYFNYYNKDLNELSNVLYNSVNGTTFDLNDIFQKFNLKNCAAIITNSWNLDVTSFVEKHDLPMFKCLYAMLTDCLINIFNMPTISAAFEEFYEVVQTNIKQNLKILPEIYLPCPWSKLNFLIFVFDKYDFSNLNHKTKIVDEIYNFVNFIKPLKLILNALVDEPFPFCTMMLPFTLKLFEDHFTAYNLKNEYILEAYHILEAEISKSILENTFLCEATFFDGRFQPDTNRKGTNRSFIKQNICKRFKSYIDSTNKQLRLCKNEPDAYTDTNEFSRRKSGLKSFFHTTFNSSNANASAQNSVIARKPSIDIEFEKFECEPMLDLSSCPLNWWQQNGTNYKQLGYIVKFYLSAPCCANRFYHYDDNERWIWQNKRFMLRQYNSAEQCMWYLHYNKNFYVKLIEQ